jgi:hypothetical protein
MPVPAMDSSFIKIENTEIEKYLNFTWIGRLCDFKSHILIYTLKKVSLLAYERKLKINYNIIGDGPFKSKIANLNVNHKWFSLNMLGSLEPKHLDTFLLKNTDVLTAMGTSALEGAKLGIPTILLDISYYPIKGDYKFRWLHNSHNYDLAHDLTNSDFKKDNNTLNKMIDDLIQNYKLLSDQTLEYFQLNHSIQFVLMNFITKIQKTQMKFSELDPLLFKKSIVRKIYDRFKYKKIKE